MNGGRTLVSVILAVHNERRHIGACLRSLEAQTWHPLELLVADDGSTDGTPEHVAALGTRALLIRGPHRGKARTLNDAALQARGEVLLFLDADMTFAPDYVERMVRPILEHGAPGTAHGTEHVANPENVWARCWQLRAGLPPQERIVVPPELAAHGSAVYRAVRRQDFLAHGGFDDVGYMDDQTLAPKLGQNAHWVMEAVCWHHNVESLQEVFALGRWGAQDLAYHRRFRAIITFSPPFALLRAAKAMLRHRYAPMFGFELAYMTGLWWGLTGLAIRRFARD